MKTFIKILLRENLESKLVSVIYLKNLRDMITNKSDKDVLSGWIKKANGSKIELNVKQYQLLQNIKGGGQSQTRYSSKN